MKKSKLIALILTFIFILTACGESGSGYLFDYTQQLIGPFYFKTEEGVLFIENTPSNEFVTFQKINYLDFESKEKTVLCTKPGCTHESADETCWGNLGDIQSYFVGGDKLFYFKSSSDPDKEIFLTELYVSDINRQNERLIETFEGSKQFMTIVHQDSVFFSVYEQEGAFETGTNSNPYKLTLIGYNCKEGQVIGETEVIEGYEAHISPPYGMFNDKILYRTSYSDTQIDWGTMTEEDISSNMIETYLAIDTKTMEFTQSDSVADLLGMNVAIDELHEVYNNIAYYNTDGVLYAYDLDSGENTVIYEGELEAVVTVGDKLMYLVNFENNELYHYDLEAKESKRVYYPNGGTWGLGSNDMFWHEHGDYIFANSASFKGPVGEYEQGSPFIIKVHKDDIYKEEYEAEIVS